MISRWLIAALFGAAPFVYAEETETVSPVIVTASRVPETADETLAPVAVITRDEIERSQAPTILELLRTQTGVDVVRTGGTGAETSVFLRGTNSNHLLVLIDGMRVSSATTGAFAWQNLDPAQIERIEIVRGPRSTLYGSDAIGGVIQIFTRKSTGRTLRMSGGSYGTYGLQAGYGGGDQIRYHLYFSGNDSEGFNATNKNAASPYFTPDGDKDGYRNRSVSAAVTAPLGTAEATLNVWRSEGRLEYDNGTQETVNQAMEARLSGELTNDWEQTLRVGTAVDDLDDHSAYSGRFITTRRTVDWQHNFSIAERQLLVAGVDWTESRGENRDFTGYTAGYDHRISDRGAYLNYSVPVGTAEFQAGLRRDDYDLFGEQTTGQLALGYNATEKLRILASYGTAFKAPSLNDLYYPGFSNPDLKPERSKSGEVGMRYHVDPRQRVEMNLFQTNVKDLIEWDLATYVPHNVAKARIRGIELEYFVAPERWDFSAHLTLQEPRNVATDKPLLRRPDKKLALVAARNFGAASVLRAEAVLVGDRRDGGNAERTLPGYGLVNVSAIHPFANHWRMEGRIDNLFDQDYTEAYGFQTPGRVFSLAVAYGY